MRKIPSPFYAAITLLLTAAGLASLITMNGAGTAAVSAAASSMPSTSQSAAVHTYPHPTPRVVVSPDAQKPLPWAPAPCALSRLPAYFYAAMPAKPDSAGPGKSYKESKNAFGPSAVPYNWAKLAPAERLHAVRREFLLRHCGSTTSGGDKKLFQVGYPGLDTKHLARAATHPTFDANRPMSRAFWQAELATYLGAIRWDKSYVTYENLGRNTWTLTMRTGGDEPVVRTIQHQQPKSHYLMLAITQPDGTLAYERRRLECGFQNTYRQKGNVPVSFMRHVGE